MSGVQLCRFLLKNPKVRFALFVILCMCVSNSRLLDSVMPRYLCDRVFVRGWLCKV